MQDTAIPSLAELRERSENIIEEIYSILSNPQIEQKHFEHLNGLLQESTSTLKQIDGLQSKKQNEQTTIELTIKDTQQHRQELDSILNQSLAPIAKRIKDEKELLVSSFALVHHFAAQIKKTTLFKKSIRLFDREIDQLTKIKEDHQRKYRQVNMFTELQLNKQNEQAEFILDLITNETNLNLSKLKEKRALIDKELTSREIQYEETYKRYVSDLQEQNRQKIASILNPNQQTQVPFKIKTNLSKKETKSPTTTGQEKPFQTQVVYLNETSSNYRPYVAILLIATLAIVIKILSK